MRELSTLNLESSRIVGLVQRVSNLKSNAMQLDAMRRCPFLTGVGKFRGACLKRLEVRLWLVGAT